MRSISDTLPAKVILDIEYQVRELSRQRTTNRVRAEHALKRYGYRCLPYLEPAATFPFQLTRRAVQRIVAQSGDLHGAPYAIQGLTDEDYFVRELAYEALRSLMDAHIPYDPSGSPREQAAAQQRYEVLWRTLEKQYLTSVVADQL